MIIIFFFSHLSTIVPISGDKIISGNISNNKTSAENFADFVKLNVTRGIAVDVNTSPNADNVLPDSHNKIFLSIKYNFFIFIIPPIIFINKIRCTYKDAIHNILVHIYFFKSLVLYLLNIFVYRVAIKLPIDIA